ncbi:MAG: sigma-54-dependent Fis family transcriptional regulator [Planctomycetes bacterium]|nr:sigma-54-dependent Fis family transcriptional regulator [Planctomycetota bacterium]
MGAPAKILVIDDEEAICFAFQRYFEPRGYRVRVAATGAAGLADYAKEAAEVVFLDVLLPDTDGIEVLAQLCEQDPNARVVVITAHGSLETVTRAIRGRAFDYLVKPVDLDRAGELVAQAQASRRAAAAVAATRPAPVRGGEAALVGRSPAIQEVYKSIGRVAESDSAVLIVGETGTGKELVARAIHEHSRRRAGPFVAVNCGALPENLVESELFGYARGAFTGATTDKPGRFEAADGGSLFFDEVGELPPAAQVKLLRFLDTQTVERLGSVEALRLDVRILAATNRDLAGAMAAGRFRQDLYYRIAVIQIPLPPLAERAEDVVPLANHFLALKTPAGRAPPIFSREAAAVLEAYRWPGNVRELRNAVEHAAVASGGGPILPAHLPEVVRQGAARPGAQAPSDLDALIEQFLVGLPAGSRLGDLLPRLEKALICRTLADAGGNQSLAAQRLGMHRNTLRNKLRDLGLDT